MLNQEARVVEVTLMHNKWEIAAKRTADEDDILDAYALNPKDIPRDILEAIHDFVVRGLET